MQEKALFTQADPAVITSCRETQLGNTLYRVISVSKKDFDWGRAIENLAVRQAVAERPVEERAVAECAVTGHPAVECAVAKRPVEEQTVRVPEQLPGSGQEKGAPL